MLTQTKPIRILVIDDHPVVRQGLRSLLSNHADLQIVAEADNLTQALEATLQHRPHVVLLDIRLPGTTGIEVARKLHQAHPQARILVLTSYDDDEYLLGALEAGADGYLLKNVSDEGLVEAIHAVHRGERLISPALVDRMLRQFAEVRHSQVQSEAGLSNEDIAMLRMVAAGASNEEIAAALCCSTTSAKRKAQAIFEKLGATTRTQAAVEAVRRGLI
jgi:DNA-binding NarL/FixJ family response regulator